jgi:hypothetical protein
VEREKERERKWGRGRETAAHHINAAPIDFSSIQDPW